MDVSPHLWDVKNNRASGKSAEAQRINRAVDKIRVEVNLRYQELMKTDRYVTAAKLKDAYLGIDIKQETLLKLFEQHNAEFAKKVGHSRVKGTFQRYITVYKHIREFLPHYHSELFTYHLWVEKFKDEDIFFEGFCKEYAWQKRSDISPHISIKDFSYKHNKYSIEIYTVLNANHDFDKFQLTFGFNNENKFDYPDEIIEILKELGIENEDETVNWFSWYCKSENSILSKTKYLADALFQLKQKK